MHPMEQCLKWLQTRGHVTTSQHDKLAKPKGSMLSQLAEAPPILRCGAMVFQERPWLPIPIESCHLNSSNPLVNRQGKATSKESKCQERQIQTLQVKLNQSQKQNHNSWQD